MLAARMLKVQMFRRLKYGFVSQIICAKQRVLAAIALVIFKEMKHKYFFYFILCISNLEGVKV